MVDVESRNQQSSSVPNPYAGPGQQPGGAFPANHPINKIKTVVYMSLSIYGLMYFNFFRVIIRSPHVSHEWFKIGLACTIAILGIKGYVEMFEGKMQHKKINYKNYPQTTHSVMVLILLSTIAFNVALWPHYGWNTPIILGICFFGVVVQFLILVPTYIQNLVSFILLTFFLQQYAGVTMYY